VTTSLATASISACAVMRKVYTKASIASISFTKCRSLASLDGPLISVLVGVDKK
jgi:uncharacterized protein YaaW (UPF0174 family)